MSRITPGETSVWRGMSAVWHIAGVGVTQSRSLWDAEMMARDLISRREGIAGEAFAVAVTPEIGGGLDERSRAARRAVAEASNAQRMAATQAREAARRLRQAGLSGRDIAKVLDVSPQRVSQLLKDPRGRGEATDARIAAG